MFFKDIIVLEVKINVVVVYNNKNDQKKDETKWGYSVYRVIEKGYFGNKNIK